MTSSGRAVGGPLWTRGTILLAAFAGVGIALITWRFVAGLGASTALTDGYPWGLWIAMDVVVGTALACGGYAVALLAYILNKGRYHPLVRPALLTSLLGYGLAGLAIFIDVGRGWFVYRLLDPGKWNHSSVLLEVALCVMAYLVVLFLELAPAWLEKLEEMTSGTLAGIVRALHRFFEKIMVLLIALGILLPTMHQSSLGSVLLLGGHKLHPLWNTPWLGMLFLLSCVGMGYAAVIFEGSVSSKVFRLPQERDLLQRLGVPAGWLMLAWSALRLGDVAYRGHLGTAVELNLLSLWFWLELLAMAAAGILLLLSRLRLSPVILFRLALLTIFAGAYFRFNAYLVAYDPGPGWVYFPAVTEILVTLGILSLEALLYVVIVRRFPILAPAASHS